jgi:hypothetical protein
VVRSVDVLVLGLLRSQIYQSGHPACTSIHTESVGIYFYLVFCAYFCLSSATYEPRTTSVLLPKGCTH